MASERERLIKARRELTELELARKREELVEVEAVHKEVFAMARRVRDRILNVPSRISAAVAAETDARVIDRMITQELRTALIELGKMEVAG
ncbi:MAG: hypothetical protein HQL86_00170 [Magnetococcales bacterium]|nr:hypothetical protein [Magnetococcales bacterium]